MDKETIHQFVKSLVRPHLEYATSVWSPMYKKDIVQIACDAAFCVSKALILPSEAENLLRSSNVGISSR